MSLGKRITSLLLVCACILLPLTGCAHDAREGDTELTPAASPSDSDWEEMQENVVLENDRIRFTLDAATTHFTVCDKRTGRVYSSVPAEEIAFGAEEIAARSCSELTLHYYEEQSDVNYMYSTADSVAMDNYSIRSNGTAVRVYYRFGSMDTVLPLVLDEESEEFLELINPEIIVQSGEQTGLEGCLSVPGKWGIVTRPNRVRVRAQDRDGAWFEAEAEGLTARAFCHEIEHLDGHLFIEHIDHFLTEEELKEYLEDEE